MLKKTITYENWDGVEVTEDFYFNLTKAELLFHEMEEDGGLQAKMERIVASKDNKEIMRMVKWIILTSYGEKSPDGKRFMKSEEIRNNFEASAAFNALIEDLLLSGDDSAKSITDFIEGILPKVKTNVHA